MAKLSNITPIEIKVGFGDLMQDQDMVSPETNLIKQIGEEFFVIGSTILKKELMKHLPKTDEELLDFAGVDENGKEIFLGIEDNIRNTYLARLSTAIMEKVEQVTLEAISKQLKDFDIDLIKTAFSNSIREKMDQVSEYSLTFREPTETEFKFMMLNKNDNPIESTERMVKVMFDCLIGHNLTNDDGSKSSNKEVETAIRAKGSLMYDIHIRWQQNLPLPTARGKSSGK